MGKNILLKVLFLFFIGSSIISCSKDDDDDQAQKYDLNGTWISEFIYSKDSKSEFKREYDVNNPTNLCEELIFLSKDNDSYVLTYYMWTEKGLWERDKSSVIKVKGDSIISESDEEHLALRILNFKDDVMILELNDDSLSVQTTYKRVKK